MHHSFAREELRRRTSEDRVRALQDQQLRRAVTVRSDVLADLFVGPASVTGSRSSGFLREALRREKARKALCMEEARDNTRAALQMADVAQSNSMVDDKRTAWRPWVMLFGNKRV